MEDQCEESINLVAAIDFGTTYSGYVFSLAHDELKFFGPQIWNSGHGGYNVFSEDPDFAAFESRPNIQLFWF